MIPPTENNNKTKLLGTLMTTMVISGLFIVVVSFAVKAIFFQTSDQGVREVVETVIEEKEIILRAPKCDRSFAEYKNLVDKGQSISILENKYSYASTNGKFAIDYNKKVRREGEVACGYLYVKASNGARSLSYDYDSIYINPQELGGHLLRPRSIEMEETKENKTEVLFPLSAVPYLPNVPYNPTAQNFEITNWVKLLNSSQKIKMTIALSTMSQAGLIEEVRIAYRCWNPDTGKEVHDCQLSLDN